MKSTIIYPLPFDHWTEFSKYAVRFANSLREFPLPPETTVYVVCNWSEPTDHIREMFYGIRARAFGYYGNGCDFGSAQHVLEVIPDDTFMVMMTSRCYAHRPGWMERFIEARQRIGPAVFSASASWEGGTPHLCTRAYAMDARTFRQYPHRIETREQGQLMETGEWCLTRWAREQKLGCWQVTFDGEQEQDGWRFPENVFRKGDQSAMLIHDKHTDAWRDADPAEKERLTALANPPQ